jgi:ABC-type antimicrobial peptide transport system permease subunit
VAEVHPAVAPTRIQTTRAAARSAIATREALALVSALFGLGALLLAALGIYGLIAQNVIRRRREMGIRMAVGARSRDVLTLVLTDGFRLAIAGIAIGLLSCFAVMRLIRSFLWGIGASDPFALTFAAAILLGATAAACALPAFRAARVDPVDSLRSG